MKIKTSTNKMVSLPSLCLLSALLIGGQTTQAALKPIEQMVTKVMETELKCHDIKPQTQQFKHCLDEFTKLVHMFMDIRNKASRHHHMDNWKKVNAELLHGVIKPLEVAHENLKTDLALGSAHYSKELIEKDLKKLKVLITSLKEIHDGIDKACTIFINYSGSTDLASLMALANKLSEYNLLLPEKIRAIDPFTMKEILTRRFACDKSHGA